MTKEDRDIQRKLKVLRHAKKIGDVGKTCRYFGIGRSSFYRWRAAYEQRGEAGLINAKPIPKNPANQTPPEIVEKVLYLRSKYHLGSIRIVWYLARYHGITISDAGVTRILRRNGVGYAIMLCFTADLSWRDIRQISDKHFSLSDFTRIKKQAFYAGRNTPALFV